MEIEEEQPEPSGCAGTIVIATVVLAPLGALYAFVPDLFVVLFWVTGWGAVVWAARRTPKSVQDAPDPAPPAPSERGAEKKPQVTMVRDVSHPNRWVVTAPSRWLGVEIEKES